MAKSVDEMRGGRVRRSNLHFFDTSLCLQTTTTTTLFFVQKYKSAPQNMHISEFGQIIVRLWSVL